MNRPAINWIPLSLLIAVAALSFWLQRAVQENPDAPAAQTSGVDFWADNFVVRRFGPAGKLQSVLHAQRMEHESSDDSSILLTPRIEFARTPPLTVRAERGEVSGKGDIVEFVGKVQLDREADKRSGKAPLQVRTERMKVYPDRQLAEGRVPVRFEQKRSVVTAGSYRVDSKSGVSVLEGRVRATIQRKDS